MKLESQVCSLELSKKLKSLGVKQTALCFWNHEVNPPKVIFSGYKKAKYVGFASAFTSAELGEMLPNARWTEEKCMAGFRLFYIENNGKEHHIFFYDDTSEANARAKMMIYLIENGLLSVTL